MALSNCYCGQEVDNALLGIKCINCRNLFHKRCTSVFNFNILHGDVHYLYICSVCNCGKEVMGRIELEWVDITHLLLYNLSVVNNEQYFDFNNVIVPFLENNWARFQIYGPAADFKEDLHFKLLETLQKFPDKFICSKEMNMKNDIWGLKIKIPPAAPDVSPSAKKTLIVWNLKTKLNFCYELANERRKQEAQIAAASFRSAQKGLLDSLMPHCNFEQCNPFEENHESKNITNKKYLIIIRNGKVETLFQNNEDYSKEVVQLKPTDLQMAVSSTSCNNITTSKINHVSPSVKKQAITQSKPSEAISVCKCSKCQSLKDHFKSPVKKPVIAQRNVLKVILLRKSQLFKDE